MFFFEKIKNIKKTDKVLEIGPGALHHPRTDVILELQYSSKEEEQNQFGHTGSLKTNKPIVYYDGGTFPFQNKEFDYVICSHVLEHVENVHLFLNEVFRVSNKGYFEFPSIYYEYLYNFEVHKNILNYEEKSKTLHFTKKDLYFNDNIKLITNQFSVIFGNGIKFLGMMPLEFIAQGFEWENEVQINETTNFANLIYNNGKINSLIQESKQSASLNSIKTGALFKEILNRFLKKII